mmetsp:Transcript_7888/g.23208  ORF Transcript_7888/g.23208 Transcript_7888/m.23208 type:complete len:201 (+) Transcript_7888:1549-2151(+)
MPPRASLIFFAVFIAVWLTYPATRSPFCTSTTLSFAETPSWWYSLATSRDTVVLPTPGLPVNIMCRMASRVLCPSARRRMSRESCLQSCSICFLTDSMPISLESSSFISASALASCSSVSGSGSTSSSSLSSSSSLEPPPPPAFFPPAPLPARPCLSASARCTYSRLFSRIVLRVTGFFSYLVAVMRYSAALQYLLMASS